MFKIGNILLRIFVLLIFFKGTSQENDFKKSISLELNNLNFIQNNEYFNNIADGYTLIGTQLHPKIAYQPHEKLQMRFGVFGLYYSGMEKYHKVIPTFSMDYITKKGTFTMGTLHNDDLHHLIKPLMTSETSLDERSLENGIQYQYQTSKFTFDSWLNWETFIFKGDSKNEEFVYGISSDYLLVKMNKWQLNIPLQNLFYHHGGQINTDLEGERITYTMRHTALGLVTKYEISENQSIQWNSYFIQHQSTGIPMQYIYKKGTGILTELNYSYKNLSIGFGYWKGNKFVSPYGDDMYQSVSRKTDIHYENVILQEIYAGHTEADRSLILGQLTYEKELISDLHLVFEIHTFYQNYSSNPTSDNPNYEINNQFDYNMGLRLYYRGNFKLNH